MGVFLHTHERGFLQFADTLKCAEAVKSKYCKFLQDVCTQHIAIQIERSVAPPDVIPDGVVHSPEACCLSRVNGQIPCFQLSEQCFTCHGNKPIFKENHVNLPETTAFKLSFAK